MNLRDRIKELANARGLSIPNLEAELDFGNGTIVRWNKSTPTADKLSKVADYLDVTVDYLLGRELNTRDERDISKDLNRIMKEIQSGEDGPLYYNGVEIDGASIGLLQNAIEYALRETKKENKVLYNPTKNKK